MKKHLYTLLVLLLLVNTSCDTEIPETDTTPPTFSLKITGDGFDHTFTQDDDLENLQLNLKEGVSFDILYIGSDTGGVKFIQLQYNKNIIEFTETNTPPWTEINVSSTSNILEWQGDHNNPKTSGILSGKFITSRLNSGGAFKIYVADFGGDSNESNTIFDQLNLFIVNTQTGLIQL